LRISLSVSGRDEIVAGTKAETAGDFVGAAAAYQAALDDQSVDTVGDAQFHLGRLAWRQGQFDAARERFELARGVALTTGDTEARARAENGLGLVHYSRGEYVQARAALTVARDLARDPVMRAKALLNLGIISNIEGDYDGAQSNYIRSRAAFQQAEDRAGEVLALNNLGMLYADLQNWESATHAFEQCLDLCEMLGDRVRVAAVLVNRSEVRSARKEFDKAIADCDRAISIAEAVGAEAERGEALRWKGRALWLSGRHEPGEATLREAVRIAHRTHVKLLEAEASHDLGLQAIELGEIERAKKWLARSLQLFEGLGAQRELASVREELERLNGE
jgi:tetratricopeptide (TPR) repeat protein